MIEIDGTKGGGQMLRTALALSALTKRPFRMKNICMNREKEGLAAQHLRGVEVMKEFTDAFVEGAEIGSTELLFYPRSQKPKSMEIDIGTAGSITLLLQSLLPFLVFFKKRITLTIIGGTDAKLSPSIDYYKEVFLPQLKRFADIELKILQRGFCPKGNGKIEITIKPREKKSFSITKLGKLQQIKGFSVASSNLQERQVAERQAESASFLLKNSITNISSSYAESDSAGSILTLVAIYTLTDDVDLANPIRIGVDVLGEREKTSENVGQEAAKSLLKQMDKNPCDEYLGDQLIPYLGYCGGSMKVNAITDHVISNIHVTEKFLPVKFFIEENTITAELIED